MEKSPEAFRTISEVADWLGVPTHVLRFWESRFSQVKPVKRAGGRRYYRPSDMLLIGGIKQLLHDDGMTIRGVQKLLREEGVKHVAGFSQPLDTDGPMRDVSPEAEDAEVAASPMAVDVEPEPVDNVVPLAPAEGAAAAEPEPEPEEEPAPEEEPTPELAFLHRKEPAPKPAEPARDTAREPDLFTSRRSAPAEAPPPEPARPKIPPTPDVPATDPADDDPAYAALPGVAARLRTALPNGLRIDPAVIARAVSDLRALRDGRPL